MNIINNKSLLVKIQDELYPWDIAAPIIISKYVFNKELSEQNILELL